MPTTSHAVGSLETARRLSKMFCQEMGPVRMDCKNDIHIHICLWEKRQQELFHRKLYVVLEKTRVHIIFGSFFTRDKMETSANFEGNSAKRDAIIFIKPINRLASRCNFAGSESKKLTTFLFLKKRTPRRLAWIASRSMDYKTIFACSNLFCFESNIRESFLIPRIFLKPEIFP